MALNNLIKLNSRSDDILLNDYLDDDGTIGDGSIRTVTVMGLDDSCVKHPEVMLRQEKNGSVFQREACPECEKEYQQNQLMLKKCKAELDHQLKQLDEQQQQEHQQKQQDISSANSNPKTSSTGSTNAPTNVSTNADTSSPEGQPIEGSSQTGSQLVPGQQPPPYYNPATGMHLAQQQLPHLTPS